VYFATFWGKRLKKKRFHIAFLDAGVFDWICFCLRLNSIFHYIPKGWPNFSEILSQNIFYMILFTSNESNLLLNIFYDIIGSKQPLLMKDSAFWPNKIGFFRHFSWKLKKLGAYFKFLSMSFINVNQKTTVCQISAHYTEQ
jgi:hypothetical protein